MTKSELRKLLEDINNQYWNKLKDIITDVGFLNTWYEALKDYDYDLIKYIYGKYNDTQFPPTAKYFTVFAEQMLATIKEEIRLATNEIWIFSTDDYETTRDAITEYVGLLKYKDKLEEINRVRREFVIATRDNKTSIKDWLNERRM